MITTVGRGGFGGSETVERHVNGHNQAAIIRLTTEWETCPRRHASEAQHLLDCAVGNKSGERR